ncbi:MAG: GntR family transcriptional regulator [Oscillospiraceae bacterium]|jgi:GntR family transcriptional regulator|nr:GntR family transcriptional regulator [Oscillospiraceae bacterium]
MHAELDETLSTSLYSQLKKIILDNIKSGKWPVNTKIPTEVQLCDMYHVSRITVRQALNDLKQDGFLYRKQGKGTFVREPKLEQNLSRFYSFSTEIKKMGYTPSTRILNFEVTDASPEVLQKLKLKPGSKVYAITRLRLADSEPVVLEISYLPYSISNNLKEQDVKNFGLYSTLIKTIGCHPNKAEESFEAVLMNQEEAKYLHAKPKDAALRLERCTYADSKLVEYCISIIKGDKYTYKITLM